MDLPSWRVSFRGVFSHRWKMRQFQYKLDAGESGWALRLDKAIE